MSFVLYDITFLVIFSAFIAFFLYKRRKKWEREGIIILYRTQLGIKIIEYISKKYKKFLNFVEYFVVFTGYILMVLMVYFLGQIVFLFIKFPEIVRAVKIPPIAPLIPYLPQLFKADYLPMFYFTYWILVLGVTAVTHEFFHGIFARARGVKIKSTGFAFLGPFIGAFVEPDENKVKKLKIKEQLGFLTAGTFANVLVTILFFIIMWLFFISTFTASGVIFDDYIYTIINVSDISGFGKNLSLQINGGIKLTEINANNQTYYIETQDIEKLKEYDFVKAYYNLPAIREGLAGIIVKIDNSQIKEYEDMEEIFENKKLGDNVLITTLYNNKEKTQNIILEANPNNLSQPYLGIAFINADETSVVGKLRTKMLFFKEPHTYYIPKFANDFIIFVYNLFWWMVLINLSVALVNMMPVGIFDGGRVFFLTVKGITKSEKIAKFAFKLFTWLVILSFVLLTLLWGFYSFN